MAITLVGNTTLTLTNLEEGMSGNIDITNNATIYTFEFTGYDVVVSPTLTSTDGVIDMSGSSKIDCLSW
jgi:hypothetical protein